MRTYCQDATGPGDRLQPSGPPFARSFLNRSPRSQPDFGFLRPVDLCIRNYHLSQRHRRADRGEKKSTLVIPRRYLFQQFSFLHARFPPEPIQRPVIDTNHSELCLCPLSPSLSLALSHSSIREPKQQGRKSRRYTKLLGIGTTSLGMTGSFKGIRIGGGRKRKRERQRAREQGREGEANVLSSAQFASGGGPSAARRRNRPYPVWAKPLTR